MRQLPVEIDGMDEMLPQLDEIASASFAPLAEQQAHIGRVSALQHVAGVSAAMFTRAEARWSNLSEKAGVAVFRANRRGQNGARCLVSTSLACRSIPA